MSLTFSNYIGNEDVLTKYDQIFFTWTPPYNVLISQIVINASGGINNGGYIVCNIWANNSQVFGSAYGINSVQDTIISININLNAGQNLSIQWTTLETGRYLYCRYVFGGILPVRITYSPTQSINFSDMISRFGIPSNVPMSMSQFSRFGLLPRMAGNIANNIPQSNSDKSVSTLLMTPFTTRPVYSLGYYGTWPWYEVSYWPDSSSQWIWTDYNIDQKWFCFWKYFYLPNYVDVRAYLAADNYGRLYVDGILRVFNSNWNTTSISDSYFTLSPGLHIIEVNAAENYGTPTAFLACLAEAWGAGVFLRTDTSWKCIDHSISYEQEINRFY